MIFLLEGVLPALTSHSKAAVDGIIGLGYPYYFINILTTFKVLGALTLIIPQVPARVKEWAYAGFMIDFTCAFISIATVAGFVGIAVLPLVAIAVLVLSYVSYHKMKSSSVVPQM